MTKFRVKLLQNGTQHYIDGKLTYDEAEERLDYEEAIHRSAGWKIEHGPGKMVLTKGGLERTIEVEIAD